LFLLVSAHNPEEKNKADLLCAFAVRWVRLLRRVPSCVKKKKKVSQY